LFFFFFYFLIFVFLRPWRALEITKLSLASGGRSSTRTLDVLGQAILFESSEKERRMQDFLTRRSR
jgi:hypothetical protein